MKVLAKCQQVPCLIQSVVEGFVFKTVPRAVPHPHKAFKKLEEVQYIAMVLIALTA